MPILGVNIVVSLEKMLNATFTAVSQQHILEKKSGHGTCIISENGSG